MDARGSLLSVLQRYPRLSGYLRPPVGAGESAPLELLAYSRNGTRVVGVDRQGRLSLWDISTGRSRIAVARDYGSPTSLAVSHDGRTAFVGDRDGTIYEWDLTAAQLQGHLFKSLPGRVMNLALTSDHELLAVNDRSDIYRWDTSVRGGDPEVLKREGLIERYRPDAFGPAAFGPAAFSPSGTILASSVSRGIVSLTELASGDARTVHIGEQDRITFMAFSPSDDSLAVATNGGQILILKPSNGYRPRTVPSRDGVVRALSFSDDGELLAAAYESPDSQTTVSLFDAETGRGAGSFEALASWPGRTRVAGSMAIDSEDDALLTPSSGGVVLEWSTESELPFGEHLARVGFDPTAISEDGATLAVWRESAIQLINASTEDVIDQENTDRNVLDLTFAPDGSMLASTFDACRRPAPLFFRPCTFQPGGSDIFMVSSDGSIEQSIALPVGYVFASFALDGRVALGSTKGVVVADISSEPPSGRVMAPMSGQAEVIQVALSPVGVMIYRIDSGKLIGQIRRQGQPFYRFPPSSTAVAFDEHALMFTPDSGTLIVGTSDDGKTLLLMDAPRGRSIERSLAADTYANVAVDPEGDLAASALDGRLTLWDLATGRAIGSPIPFPLSTFGVREIIFTSSDDLFSASGVVVRWDLRIESWASRACMIAGRDLTEDEWELFLPASLPYQETCPVGSDA